MRRLLAVLASPGYFLTPAGGTGRRCPGDWPRRSVLKKPSYSPNRWFAWQERSTAITSARSLSARSYTPPLSGLYEEARLPVPEGLRAELEKAVKEPAALEKPG